MSFRLLDERDIVSLNKNYSNGIKGALKGEVVRADEVSPMEHNAKVKVSGKNLIPFPYNQTTKTVNGVTITVNEDGSITLNGTSTGAIGFPLFIGEMPLKGKYTLSGVTNTNDGESTHYLQPYIGGVFKTIVANGSRTYDIDDNLTQISLFIKSGYSFDNVIVYPQFEEGETATEYTPYVDPASITVTKCGKNLLPYPYSQSTKEVNGVVFTDNGDGTITINGTPTENSSITLLGVNHNRIHLPKGVTFRFHGGVVTNSADELYAFLAYDNGTANEAGEIVYAYDYGRTNGKSFTPAEDSYVYSSGIVVKAGYTFNNVVFKPQLEVGDVSTGFESYSAETLTPSADGSCDVKTISPTMTLLTDTEGAVIECEYTKDATAVIEKLTNAIIAMGGTV